jgi:ParB family chromosome partitioning protein
MIAKPRGLGRGLNALFEDDDSDAPAAAADKIATEAKEKAPGTRRQDVFIDLLQPGKFQPRTLFHDDTLSELAESIKNHGLLQPILVRPIGLAGGKYEIIAGERRWRAAQKAQLHEVPVIIRNFSDEEAMEIALVENLQREDLNPVDEAMGYKKLMEEFSHTQEKLAEILGKSRSHIANMVRLLNLPDVVLAYVERGDLSMGHARALVTAKNPQVLAKQIVADGLSVRETEKLVAHEEGRPQKVKPGAARIIAKDVDTLALEKDLANNIGMRVSIDSKNGEAGKVSIEFKTLDQLDEVIKRLSR